ncbi:unnamed protein product [Phytomonas sp. Hart1]|nr:unnamed protein product [Phytomonas sp. Hart1]|eukprot:CCW67157.1 unnamed protein product [Phytomonas sp. isolate Hart1]
MKLQEAGFVQQKDNIGRDKGVGGCLQRLNNAIQRGAHVYPCIALEQRQAKLPEHKTDQIEGVKPIRVVRDGVRVDQRLLHQANSLEQVELGRAVEKRRIGGDVGGLDDLPTSRAGPNRLQKIRQNPYARAGAF